MKNHNPKIMAAFFLIAVAVSAILILNFNNGRNDAVPANDLDLLAKCLADKGATMYGVYWCSHCENEKKAFAESFRFVNYVECAKETDKCAGAGVSVFPTWIFPDGRRFEGEQGLLKLSAISGCPL